MAKSGRATCQKVRKLGGKTPRGPPQEKQTRAPRGSVVKSPPVVQGHWKIPCAAEQLSLCAATPEPVSCSWSAATRPKCSRVHAPQQEKLPQQETHTPQLSNSPLAAIRESLHTAAETSTAQNNERKLFSKDSRTKRKTKFLIRWMYKEVVK